MELDLKACGARMKARRMELKLTRRQLSACKALDVTEGTIARWEAGENMVPVERYPALAVLLEVPSFSNLYMGSEVAS